MKEMLPWARAPFVSGAPAIVLAMLLLASATPAAWAQSDSEAGRTVRIMHGHVHVDGRHVGIVDLGDSRSAARTVRAHAPEVAERADRQRAFRRRGRILAPLHHPLPLHPHHALHPHGGRPHPPHPVRGTTVLVDGRRGLEAVGAGTAASTRAATPPMGEPTGPDRAPRPTEAAEAPPAEAPPAEAPPGATRPACAHLTVRLAAGAVHRLRVSLHSLDAPSTGAALDRIRERVRGGWPLVLEGIDGRSLAAPASLVEAVEAEPCPGNRERGAEGADR